MLLPCLSIPTAPSNNKAELNWTEIKLVDHMFMENYHLLWIHEHSGFVKPFISFDYINIYLQLDFLMRCCTMYINMRRSKSCFVLSQTNRINLLFFLHLFIDYNWTIYSWHQIDGFQISLVKKKQACHAIIWCWEFIDEPFLWSIILILPKMKKKTFRNIQFTLKETKSCLNNEQQRKDPE